MFKEGDLVRVRASSYAIREGLTGKLGLVVFGFGVGDLWSVSFFDGSHNGGGVGWWLRSTNLEKVDDTGD